MDDELGMIARVSALNELAEDLAALMINGLGGTTITLVRLDDGIAELLAAPAEIPIRTF